MRKLIYLMIVLLAILALAVSPAQAVDQGGSIVIGTIGDATSMIPMITSDAASHEMSGLVYNGLLKYDKNINLVGSLAESWTVSPDGLTITFKIRKGVKWQDGKPYTAHDAVFNWRFMTDPKTPTAYSGDYLKVKSATAPDDHTFVVKYKEPFAPGLASWTLSQMPRHLLEGKDARSSPLNRHPMGTGPFIFKRWDPGSRVGLQANPNYWEGRPKLDGVTYRVIPDMATMFLELKAGGIDWMGLNALQCRRQTDSKYFKQNFKKYRYLSNGYTYLGYNLRDPLFADRRVRQALTYAIDKKEIIKGVLLGLGRVCTGPIKPETYWFNPKVRRYPYNPAKAKELLAQAGWTDSDGDGLLDKDGQPFEFTILTNQGNTARANTGVIIQHRLAKVGITVKLRTVEWAAFINEFVKKARFEAILLGWSFTPDPDQFDVWHSSKAKPGQLNVTHYKNPEVDKLLEEQRRTFDRAKRKVLLGRFQEIIAEDQPYTFLYVPDALPIVASRFKGISPAPVGISYNFIHWWVPKALQRPGMTR